ncbi:hypothetical protein [Nonomuraea sp. CA-141351]|uniref:hypothetical protein n=1 Tax=Nonomuraea sp. CA-141351 TaxID=3239996 RepID=UPI003D8EFF1C
MDPIFGEIALAALGGATGAWGQAATTAMWERLKNRFGQEPEVGDVLDRHDTGPEAVALLTAALRRDAIADPGFRAEIEAWRTARDPSASNFVAYSTGLNAPGSVFTAPITMNFGSAAGARGDA